LPILRAILLGAVSQMPSPHDYLDHRFLFLFNFSPAAPTLGFLADLVLFYSTPPK
jgi:hypothetical protein